MRAQCCATLLVLIGAGAGAGAASADFTAAPPQARSTQAERFRAMDRDGDGVVTRAEWQGSDRSFDVHDWNRDGVLSGDELRPGARRREPWPDDPDEATVGTSDLSDWTPERFADLDHNRDGRLSRDEWHFDPELFRRVDRNHDGSVSRGEFLGVGDDDDRNDRFSDLDVNGDARISGAEWHGDPRLFGTIDTNRDGFLSRAELLGAGEDDAPTDLFASLDVNRDGLIALNEWHWSRASFDRRDRNRDGNLSRDELSSAAHPSTDVQQTPAYRTGYNRGLEDGRAAGREDRTRNNWDLDGQRELQQADAGYVPGVGPRSEYQAGYREGFTRAYREGFGPRR